MNDSQIKLIKKIAKQYDVPIKRSISFRSAIIMNYIIDTVLKKDLEILKYIPCKLIFAR